jgi:hypothetical protein
MMDLVRRIAAAAGIQGEDGEISEWFTGAHGEAPTYPAVLAAAAPTPAERRRVLEGFFEPTDADREAGHKVPTAAHRAIAELVRDGYIRVIVTTNFDRLMEQALRAVDVEPTVIHTPEQAAGMEPVHQHTCLIVKVHGDYLDPWIKNTPEELATYPAAFNEVLSRIFEDYGLIVSGWSAESDDALRGAITAARSRRYMVYWGSYDEPGPVAAELVADRRAQVIQAGADALFGLIAERVRAVADLRVAPPLNAAVAVATLKRFLPDPLQRIRLQDLVRGEADRVARWTAEDAAARRGEDWDGGKSREQLERYEALTANLRAMLAAGAFYGTADQADLWMYAIRSVAQGSGPVEREATRMRLTRYPALLLLYSTAIGALAARNYSTFARVVRETQARFIEIELSVMIYLRPTWIMSPEDQRSIPEWGNTPAPLSFRVSELLEREMTPYLPDERDYVYHFDLMEYLFSIWREHLSLSGAAYASADPGCYSVRYVGYPHHPRAVLAPLPAQAGNWLQSSGLFPDIAAFNRARERVDAKIRRD